jgi:hypothetical protein
LKTELGRLQAIDLKTSILFDFHQNESKTQISKVLNRSNTP